MRAVFALLTLVILAFAGLGCDRVVAPPLVEVTELGPRQIEPGDHLEVHGTGFPQGHVGKVVLTGTIYRAGEAAARNQTIELDGMVAAPERLEIPVRDELAERFCGRGEKAVHATFRGRAEISFASSTPNAPPLVGLLRQTTLDVLPATTRATVAESRATEGGKLLAFLGIVPGAATARGLPIEQVTPSSPAERLGIEVGDVLTSVDGVSVLSVGDVLPASARSAELGIRRASSGIDEIKTVSLVDYASGRIPTEYVPALVIVALALVVFFLLLLPGPRALVTLELRIATNLRGVSAKKLLANAIGNPLWAALASAVLAAFALTPWLIGPGLDGPALFVIGVSLLVWSAKGLKTKATTFLVAMTLLLALVLAVSDLGAFELFEMVRLQGGAPWQFAAARHPAMAVLALTYAAAVVALLRMLREDLYGVLALSALAVVAFFGGWQGPRLLLVGAALFVGKTWLLAAALRGAAHVASRFEVRALLRCLLRRILPGLLLATALVVAGKRFDLSGTLETVLALSLVAFAALLAVRIVAKVRSALARPEPHASPFL